MARRGRKTGLKIGWPSGSSGGSSAPGSRVAEPPHHHRPWLIPLVATVAVLVVLGSAGLAVALLQSGAHRPTFAPGADGGSPLPAASIAASDGVATTATAEATSSVLASTSVDVELPDVVGKSLTSAETILKAAGFAAVTRVANAVVAGVPADQVLSQSPPRGTRLRPGDTVTLTYNPRTSASMTTQSTAQPVVVIDPGHQLHPDLTREPIGPGSTTLKEKVKGGATGVFTHIPEFKRALAISLKLRDRLQAAGVKVVMIRTTDGVNIANSRRATIGNEAHAALTIRVHCDSSADQGVKGTSTLYPSGNAWCTPIEPASKRAAQLVQTATTKVAGSADRGLHPRSDMTGFNWSKVPTIIVECGFMSNSAEDNLLATPAYQDKLAAGMSAGVLAFLGR